MMFKFSYIEMAQAVADSMVADKKAALEKAQKAKSKGGATIAEKIAAEQERKANIQNACYVKMKEQVVK